MPPNSSAASATVAPMRARRVAYSRFTAATTAGTARDGRMRFLSSRRGIAPTAAAALPASTYVQAARSACAAQLALHVPALLALPDRVPLVALLLALGEG